jgi:hypothetical protein
VLNLSITAEHDDVVSEQPVVGVVQAGVITTTTQAFGTPIYVADFTNPTDLPVLPLSDSNFDSEVTLWSEPEPFLLIDSDFSESEDEAEDDMAAVQMETAVRNYHMWYEQQHSPRDSQLLDVRTLETTRQRHF